MEIINNLAAFPVARILSALGVAVLSVGGVMAYDFLALRYLERSVSRLKTLMASFLAFAMSNNLGCSFIAGNSMRYRLYSGWGLSTIEIAKIAFFCLVSSALGLFALAGLILLINPEILASLVPFPFQYLRPLGMVLILLPVTYVALSGGRKRCFSIFGRELDLPPLRLSVAQLLFSLLNWSTAAAILYLLLPRAEGLTFFAFLAIFVVSQEAGLLSQVPGGLGVFESIMLVFLSPFLEGSTVAEALVIYRIIYYVLPLSLGVAVLATQEVYRKREQIRWIQHTASTKLLKGCAVAAGRLQGARLPIPSPSGIPAPVRPFVLRDVLSTSLTRRYASNILLIVFGGFLLFFSAVPTLEGPLGVLHSNIPLPLLSVSQFMLGLVSIGLLLLAFGMNKRQDAAYVVTLALLATALAFSLFSGEHAGRAVAVSIAMGMVLPSRRHFHKQTSFGSRTLSWGPCVAVFAVFICSFI